MLAAGGPEPEERQQGMTMTRSRQAKPALGEVCNRL